MPILMSLVISWHSRRRRRQRLLRLRNLSRMTVSLAIRRVQLQLGCDGDGHPDSILGVKLHRVPGRNKSGSKYHRRLRVVCPFHPDCERSRSVAMDVAALGDKAAEIFLASWLNYGDMGLRPTAGLFPQ